MVRTRLVHIATAVVLAVTHLTPAVAQSLGDAANRAAERRARTPPARVYSDADLDGATRAAASADADLTQGRVATDGLLPGASREDVLRAVGPAVVTLETPTSRGSGFFVARHLILTNRHVLQGSPSAGVTFADGSTGHAYLRTQAVDADLALLQIDDAPRTQPVLALGSARRLRVGEEVLAVGSALGLLQNTATRGIVSAVRAVGGLTFVQTDAAINPGNSGGPLLDARGVVVGITTSKMAAAESIGLALAVDHARMLVEGSTSVAVADGGSNGDRGLGAAFSAPSGTDTDGLRRRGLERYEQAVQALARSAADVDALWVRYRASCAGGGAAAGPRDWLSLLSSASFRGDPRPGCRQTAMDVADMGQRIHDAMREAQDEARRAGVFPGAARDVRRKYGMDWPGWDR